MATEPTIAEVITGALESRLADVHTVKVGKVKSYDPLTNCADVIPVMKRPYNIGSDEVAHEELPVIPNVPVVWPRAGDFFITMPIAAGDHVVLLFTDDSIAKWRETGSVSEPGELRRHDLGSALCFAGLGSGDLDLLSMLPLDAVLRTAGMVLGKDGADAQLHWAGATIVAGRPNPLLKRVAFAALADRTDARLASLEAQVVVLTTALTALTASVAASTAALGTHTHLYSPGPGAPVPTSPMASPPTAPGGPPAPFAPNPLTTAADVLQGTGPLP